MKQPFLYILLCLLTFSCHKREKEFVKDFHEDFFEDRSLTKHKLIYLDYMDESTIDNLISSLDRDTIEVLHSSDYIVLTQEEKKAIIDSLTSLKMNKLNLDRYPNTKVISSDTLNYIFSNLSNGWSIFYQKYGEGYYSFSKPIFLRNNTLCLFYYDYNCGDLCGKGNFSVYKKTWLGWKYYALIYSWMS